jgi:hypothetical protein
MFPTCNIYVLLPCEEQISPDKVKDVVKCMHFRASKGDCVFKGDYILSEDSQVKILDFVYHFFSSILCILPNMNLSRTCRWSWHFYIRDIVTHLLGCALGILY